MRKRARYALPLAVAFAAAAVAVGAGAAPARADSLCAFYSSFTNTSTSVTVSFNVVSTPCTVSLISYLAAPSGNIPVGSVTQTFSTTGAQSLTVPLSCGHVNQVDLLLGSPPPTASTDLHAFSLSTTCETGGTGNAFTQGFWKNHPDAWPVSSLTVGGTTYSEAQLIDALNTPPKGGNAILILAHQLIAAELNVAGGAPSSCISSTIDDANALLSGHSLSDYLSSSSADGQTATSLASTLEQYNSGKLCASGG